VEPNYSIANFRDVTIGPPDKIASLIDTLRAAGMPEE